MEHRSYKKEIIISVETIKTIAHIIEAHYFAIFVVIAYLCCLWTVVETILYCWKDKYTIDYIFEWFERRKK